MHRLSTLSGSGHDIISQLKGVEFNTIIIDEACQAVETSSLIPLRCGAKKCILVGGNIIF
jgi:senataxin